MQNGSLTSALCVDVGAAERNARKSARTWHEWRAEDCSVLYFLFFSFFLFFFFPPLFTPATFFFDLASFCVVFGNQLGYLSEKITFRLWWLRNQGPFWWAERPDVDVRQAGGSWAHSLSEGWGNQEGWGCSTVRSCVDLISVEWALRYASNVHGPCRRVGERSPGFGKASPLDPSANFSHALPNWCLTSLSHWRKSGWAVRRKHPPTLQGLPHSA